MRKKWWSTVGILGFVLVALAGLTACGSESDRQATTQSRQPTPIQPTAADGLNLHRVMLTVYNAQNAAHLEALLNQLGGPNNLDLDHDQRVDYLHVNEYWQPTAAHFRGYSLYINFLDGSIHEVARIMIQLIHNGIALMEIHGDPHIYGDRLPLTTSFAYASVPFTQWAFAPRTVVYVSPYNRTLLPPGYNPVTVVPVIRYRAETKTAVKETAVIKVVEAKKSAIQAPTESPLAGKVSTEIKAPLAKPTAEQQHTQQQFKAQSLQQTLKGGDAFKKETPAKPTTTPQTATPPQAQPLAPQATSPAALPARTEQQFKTQDPQQTLKGGGLPMKPGEQPLAPPAAKPVPPALQTQPYSLAVNTPNGGETWHKGKTYTISWRASAPKTVSVRLIKSGNLVRVIAQSVPPQTSSYAWTIPADLPEGRDYKIKIVSSESTASGESNAPFVITAAPASPTTAPVVQPGTVKPPVPTIQQQLPPGSGFPKKKEESKAPAGAPQTVPGKK